MRVNQEDRRITGFRKRIIFVFGGIGIVGSLVSLTFTLSGLIPDNQFAGSLASAITQFVCWSLLVLLAIRNRLLLAAGWFTIFAPGLVTVGYVLLHGTNIYLLYGLVLVVGAALTGPIPTIIYGLSLSLLYAVTSALLITYGAVETDVIHWGNTATFSAILLATTGVLYSFGDSLGRVLRSSRQQNEEMRRLNARLQGQRQLESQIATQVADLTRILSQVSQEQNEISRRQSHIINDVASTTQQLDGAARRIADNALSVATVAEKAQKSVEAGQVAALQGVSSIGAMRERVQDINENMQSLINQLERINEVIGIIGEIADETNLLALNATIEAAGAREYGRRFAAVADEVQRLARRATNAVEQIQDMVEEINDAGAKTMAATEQGLQEAQLGDKLVTSLTAANDDVINLVAQTSNLATNIAGSTQQQREASAQIVELINDITQVSQTMIQATTEVNQIVHELEDSSARLLSADLTAPVLPSEESRVGRALRHLQALRRARPALGSPAEGEPELIVEGTTR